MAFSAKTLLIVGAGASAELGFPVGNALKENIRSAAKVTWTGSELAGIRDFCALVEDSARLHDKNNLGPALGALKHIHQNLVLSGSIDQFLSSHQAEPDVVRFAKLSIAYQIAKAERESHLNDNTASASHSDFYQIRETFLPRLWARLQNGEPLKDWKRFFENLRIITFNYDRVIEKFFALALTRFCRVPELEATDFVTGLPILHVYGSLGSMNSASGEYCAFGPDRHQTLKSCDRILTFSETVQENIRDEILNYVAWAHRIVCLGFSYANVNMELFPEEQEQGREVIGTCLGMSGPNVQFANTQLQLKFDRYRRSTLSGVTCAQLFDDFELRLS